MMIYNSQETHFPMRAYWMRVQFHWDAVFIQGCEVFICKWNWGNDITSWIYGK